LVRPETSPDDLHGMIAAEGILTSRGGLVSHAAVVARGMGTPAVCGAAALDIDVEAKQASIGDIVIREGDVISINGTTGEAILEAMDGLPVTIRLLDPPLHEFLPDIEELLVADAAGELDDAGRTLLLAARQLREVNPMLGTRGVRLGILKPGLYRTQVRALLE